MPDLWVSEEAVDMTREIRFGEPSIQKAFTDDVGQLFRYCQKEFGRCVSKVYITTKNEDGVPVGWVFQKRTEYHRSSKTFLQETWVTLFQGPKGPHQRIDKV